MPRNTASAKDTYPACNWRGAVQGHHLGQGQQQICQGGQGQQYYVHEPILFKCRVQTTVYNRK